MAFRINLRWKIVLCCLGLVLVPLLGLTTLWAKNVLSLSHWGLWVVCTVFAASAVVTYLDRLIIMPIRNALTPSDLHTTTITDPSKSTDELAQLFDQHRQQLASHATAEETSPDPSTEHPMGALQRKRKLCRRSLAALAENSKGLSSLLSELSELAEANVLATNRFKTGHEQSLVSWNKFAALAEGCRQAAERVTEEAQSSRVHVGALEQLRRSTAPLISALNEPMPQMIQTLDLASAQTQAAARQCHAGLTGFNESVKGIKTLCATTSEAVRALRDLGRQTEAIDQIQTLVNDFADQTGLLAINASVLANQAGEQGQGFSVLAKEIRALSQRISSATEESSLIIDDLQLGAQQAYRLMQQGAEDAQDHAHRIVEDHALIQQLHQSLEQAETTVGQLSDRTQMIPESVRQLSRYEQQTEDALNRLNACVHQQADELLQLTQNLSQCHQATQQGEQLQETIQKELTQLGDGTSHFLGQLSRISDAAHEGSLHCRQITSICHTDLEPLPGETPKTGESHAPTTKPLAGAS